MSSRPTDMWGRALDALESVAGNDPSNIYRLDEIRFPRTLHGWRKFFWLSIGVCPLHWAFLRTTWRDWPDAFCFTCEGMGMWPAGPLIALQMNARSHRLKKLDARATTEKKEEIK